MIQLSDKKNCTGCMACVQACAKGAIHIEPDMMGHMMPVIDHGKCVNCSKCQHACPELNAQSYQMPKRAYAVWSLDHALRKRSASGGAAAEFYNYAIRSGYWICGAEYDENCRVILTVSNEQHRIERYQQSKYVYSDSRTVYAQIKALLLRNERVLFISLPCRVAGLLSYLGRKYSNLITVDIVCHGTPSSKDFIEHIGRKTSDLQGIRVDFREENVYQFCLKKSGKTVYCRTGRTDPYLAAFLEGLNYRESCYACSYAKPRRVSDITICDFWGLGQEIPFDHPYSGAVSAVLINTESGQLFFDQIKPQLFFEERPVSEAIRGNAQLNAPTPKHEKREMFEHLYQSRGFEAAVKQCLRKEIRNEQKRIIRDESRKALRRFAGLFMKRYRG